MKREEIIDGAVDAVLDMYKDIIENITLPTGKSLMPSFLISLGITALSFFSQSTGSMTFIDWRGSVIATVALGILVFIERRGISEVSRLYRAAKSGVRAATQRAAGTNPGDEVVGSDDSCDGVPAPDDDRGGNDNTV